MRRFTGAIAAPIMAGLFMAVAGCGTAAASASGASHSAALTHGGGSHTGAMAPVGPLSSPARTKPPVGAQSSVAKAFPGIWDITTWQAYRAAQTSVMQGHQPWLLDPELVVQAWAASQWSPAPTVHRIALTASRSPSPARTSSIQSAAAARTRPAPRRSG